MQYAAGQAAEGQSSRYKACRVSLQQQAVEEMGWEEVRKAALWTTGFGRLGMQLPQEQVQLHDEVMEAWGRNRQPGDIQYLVMLDNSVQNHITFQQWAVATEQATQLMTIAQVEENMFYEGRAIGFLLQISQAEGDVAGVEKANEWKRLHDIRQRWQGSYVTFIAGPNYFQPAPEQPAKPVKEPNAATLEVAGDLQAAEVLWRKGVDEAVLSAAAAADQQDPYPAQQVKLLYGDTLHPHVHVATRSLAQNLRKQRKYGEALRLLLTLHRTSAGLGLVNPDGAALLDLNNLLLAAAETTADERKQEGVAPVFAEAVTYCTEVLGRTAAAFGSSQAVLSAQHDLVPPALKLGLAPGVEALGRRLLELLEAEQAASGAEDEEDLLHSSEMVVGHALVAAALVQQQRWPEAQQGLDAMMEAGGPLLDEQATQAITPFQMQRMVAAITCLCTELRQQNRAPQELACLNFVCAAAGRQLRDAPTEDPEVNQKLAAVKRMLELEEPEAMRDAAKVYCDVLAIQWERQHLYQSSYPAKIAQQLVERCLLPLGELAEAERVLKEQFAKYEAANMPSFPKRAQLSHLLETVLVGQGKVDEAAAVKKQCEEMDALEFNPLCSGWAWEAQELARLGQLDDAEKMYRDEVAKCRALPQEQLGLEAEALAAVRPLVLLSNFLYSYRWMTAQGTMPRVMREMLELRREALQLLAPHLGSMDVRAEAVQQCTTLIGWLTSSMGEYKELESEVEGTITQLAPALPAILHSPPFTPLGDPFAPLLLFREFAWLRNNAPLTAQMQGYLVEMNIWAADANAWCQPESCGYYLASAARIQLDGGQKEAARQLLERTDAAFEKVGLWTSHAERAWVRKQLEALEQPAAAVLQREPQGQ